MSSVSNGISMFGQHSGESRNDTERVIKLTAAELSLNPAPINRNWILEGNPIARNNILSRSADGAATTILWECTAGRFRWFYDIDETVYVIEGCVLVKDAAGTRRLNAGDTFYFPKGARAEWHVENYVRKIAFCRVPQPRLAAFAMRGFRFLKRLTRIGRSADAPTAMSHSN
jgi:uncharacterized cupin superfamily protein